MIIGIDNGISGGLVAISAHHGLIIGKTPMPAHRWRKRNEVDVKAVHEWIVVQTAGRIRDALYVIEEPNNSRTPSTAYSVASSFHSLRGLLEAHHLKWERVTPQAWQKAMLGNVPKGETKKHAIAQAINIWPSEDWTKSERATKPHDGMIDAALIAEYARRTRYNQ